MSDEELIAWRRVAEEGGSMDASVVLVLIDALTRSQSRVEELEKALRNLLDTIERGDGYRAFERTAAARRALTNSEQGREFSGDGVCGNCAGHGVDPSDPDAQRACPRCGGSGRDSKWWDTDADPSGLTYWLDRDSKGEQG